MKNIPPAIIGIVIIFFSGVLLGLALNDTIDKWQESRYIGDLKVMTNGRYYRILQGDNTYYDTWFISKSKAISKAHELYVFYAKSSLDNTNKWYLVK